MNTHRHRWPNVVSRLCRALLALAVTGTLLASPIAATAHELGHLRGDAAGLAKKKSEASSVCEVCAAYAGLGYALGRGPTVVLLAPVAVPDACASLPRVDGARLHPYFERAPPRSSASA